MGIAAAFAGIVITEREALVAWIEDTGTTTVGNRFDGGPGYDEAHSLRVEAWSDYADGRYAACLKKLDEAKALSAFEDDDTQRLRALAAQALADAAPDRTP